LALSSFFFLWDEADNLVLKAELEVSQLTLFKESDFLAQGDQYKWAISQEAYPNFNNISRWNFTLIDRNTYQAYIEDMKPLVADLESLGLSKSQIENILCETYGLCR